MSHKYANLEDTVYFGFGSNDTSGSGDDGATPVFDVRLAGDAYDVAPVYSAAANLLTHANYPPGAHEIAIPATAANGFLSSGTYSVYTTVLVDSQNPTGYIGSFDLNPVLSNVIEVDSVAQRAADLAEIAQYLIANAAVLGSVMADDSIIAKIIATGGTVSGYDEDTDSQQAIRDEMVTRTPSPTAVGNITLQYDGTGITGDNFPATQEQLSNIANTGAAINKVVTTGVTNTGSETNTFAATRILDGTYHQIDQVGGEIDQDYNFNIGGAGVPVSVTMVGRLYDPAPTSNTIIIQAYNWITTSYEQVGIWDGVNSAVDAVKTVILFSSHVGTGVNSGEVDIKFVSAALDAGTILYLDLLYCSYSVVSSSVGYANGSLWLDTNASNTNTVRGVDGTADNPVSTIAAIVTLAGTTNLKRVTVSPASSFTFPSDMTGYQFFGNNYTIAFGGENADSLFIQGATLTGILTSSGAPGFIQCRLSDGASLPSGGYSGCVLPGNLTLTGAFYIFDHCLSAVAGTSAPSIDLGAVGAQSINFRHYSGGIEIQNMAAGDTMSLEGHGQLIINANCSAGTIAIRGHFTVTDNASAAVTLSNLAMFDHNDVIDGILVDTTEIGVAGAGLTNINLPNQTMNITGDLSGSVGSVTGAVGSVAGNVDGNVAGSVGSVTGAVGSVTGAVGSVTGAVGSVTGSVGSVVGAVGSVTGAVGSVTARVTANTDQIAGIAGAATALAASASTVVVSSAAAGTLTLTQMSTNLTEATNDHYNGRIIIWTSGALKDQATDITGYDGGTNILTFTAITEAAGVGDTFVIV